MMKRCTLLTRPGHRAMRLVRLSTLSLSITLTGCSTPLLGTLAAAALTSSQTAAMQDRAEQSALASHAAVAEKSPHMETAATYMQVIAQMQRKQLWFASIAHLDALEAQWGPSDASRLLRADALRQVGMVTESTRLYGQLLAGAQSARAHHGLGLLAAHEGRYDEAVVHLQRARSSNPTDALLLNDLAYALMHTEQAASARLPLMQAAQLEPRNLRVQSNVALFLVLHGSSGQASDWMHQHEMSETMRLQVFAQAQRLATQPPKTPSPAQLPKAAPSLPVVPAAPPASAQASTAMDAPAPATEQHVVSLAAERARAWMTESPIQGARP